ncbi:hypothetical protein BIW11_05107 [Tropilaelaps mercedesae]|uniref:Uncharacterized protein n=1 Tax=Tropilaelaps mercedesae TaxID=418985 RepID=A0A1V9Y3U8_9ACAR|nr:hypothetical protein BIW11_05107 [Tropilaelaps mercedesae]
MHDYHMGLFGVAEASNDAIRSGELRSNFDQERRWKAKCVSQDGIEKFCRRSIPSQRNLQCSSVPTAGYHDNHFATPTK